jgi:phage terminase large subunit
VGRINKAVTIPYGPRDQQKEIHDHLKRFNVLVCHRRFGKTVLCINEMIKAAMTCELERPRVFYIAPLYRQAKQVAWDYVQHYSRPILDAVYDKPGDHIFNSELKIEFPNGGRVQLFGGDNPDALRGVYADLVILDEPAQMPPRLWTEVIRPALADRKGKAIFIGTPMGKNAFYDIYTAAKDDPEWYAAMFKASETDIIDQKELEHAKSVMSDAQYEQEFECSFDAAIVGAYYGKLMSAATTDGRVCHVPHDPAVDVETWWDLGIGDSTAIFFVQRMPGGAVHVIDYYEESGEGLPHYAAMLAKKRDEGNWIYSEHVWPHDGGSRDLSTGQARSETMENLGFAVKIMPREHIHTGIEAVRVILPKCWFDETKCARGVEALRQYRQEWDDKKQTFRNAPLHDWTSHPADAFRTGAMNQPSKGFGGPIVMPQDHISNNII